MKTPLISRLKWKHRAVGMAQVVGLVLLLAGPAACADETNPPPAGECALVKHRVEVVVAPPADTPAKSDINLTIGKDFVDQTLPAQGASIRSQEYASAVDLLKSQLAESECLRLVETLQAAGASDAAQSVQRPLILYGRFMTQAKGFAAYLRVINRADHTLLAKGDGRGDNLAEAIGAGLRQVEKELLNRRWRCRVSDVANGRLLIPYGRLDGLRKGQWLVGHAIAAEGRKADSPVDEALILKHGTRAGRYRIVEVGEEVTALQPLDNSPMLAVGDVLEAPPVALHEIHRSRSSTIWDKIYENKK
jgi:hypothetical protein